jgi:hypothetical protein
MSILRNIQVARQYNVTPATVGNWIEQARNNKIKITLTSVNGKYYIEDSAENRLELERLKQQGVKFRSKQNDVVKVNVDPKIYDIFTEEQLVSLFVNISYYNFIPVKLSYTGEGAFHFDAGFRKSIENPISGQSLELSLIEKYFESISKRIIIENSKDSKKINLIELGADNSTYAVIDGLHFLKDHDFLNKYISVGISEDMAKIRQDNIKNELDVETSKYIFDIEENVLRNILFKEKENNSYINLCTLLFSSLSNIRNVPALLGNLVESLSPDDYLLVSTILGDDTGNDRVQNKNSQSVVKRHSWLLDLLGLTPYISAQFFDYEVGTRKRSGYFIMNRDVEVTFQINGKEYPILLERDKKITFFVSYRYVIGELMSFFKNAGFVIDQFNTDSEERFGLFLLRIKKRSI